MGIALNVPGCKRRFASPDKQTVRFAGLANCGGVRRGSERSDRPSRTQPEPPQGGEAFTILLSDGKTAA